MSTLHTGPELLAGIENVHDRIRIWVIGSLWLGVAGSSRELEK